MSNLTYDDFKKPTYPDVVQQAAIQMEKLQALYDAKRLTDEQYQELGRNILTLQESNLNLLDMERRQHIMEALSTMASIAGIIMTFI